MKQLFHIKQGSSVSGQQSLSIRLGERHVCFAISNKAGSELFELGYCSTGSWNEKELSGLLANYPSLGNSFYECQVVYDFPQAMFTPTGKEDVAVLVNGNENAGSNIITEQVPGWQFNNIYAVRKDIQHWFTQKFPTAKFRHQYSLGVKMMDITGEAGSLMVDFRKDDLTVMAAKKGKLLLAQTFPYSTPDDVLYYLLKICQRFDLSQQAVELSLSGLIDRQSSLYRELYQYFIQIRFRDAEWNTGKEYPAHFFTSLNDLAKCAS